MSLARPSSSVANSVFRFASAASTRVRCPQCHRLNFSFASRQRSARRQLQTAAAYKPNTLEPSFIPPRNAGVPDTSIAGSNIKENTQPGAAKSTESRDGAQVSLREEGAQKSRPVETQTTQQATARPDPSPSSRPRRSKLRPRKAAMTLTPKAVSQLRGLLDQPEPKLIRVGVKNRGCSGLAYHLEFVDKPGAFDETVEQDGVQVLIDSKALFSIIGSEMDWIEDKLNERFIFRNPNITEQCGCGESFSIS